MHNSFTLSFNKIFRYSFILIIPILFLLPKNAYALDFSQAPAYCKYSNSDTAYECGTAVRRQFPNAANNYGWAAPNTTFASFAYDNLGLKNFVRLEMTNQNFCNDSGENRGGTIDFYLWFDKPYASWFKNSTYDLNHVPGSFSCTTEVTLDNYGLVFHCSSSKSFVNSTIGVNIRRSTIPDEAVVIGDSLNVGVGTWTADYTCYTNESDSINENNNINTDKIIDNDNKNQQQTNDRLDKIDVSLTDDNIDSSKDKAFDFFNNFTIEDNGGISGIVTLPLRVIQRLINIDSCESLSFNVLGADVSLPSGCIMWSNAPSEPVVIYQTLICGFFAYIILVGLFHDIDRLKDPHDIGVDTLDL